VATIVGDAEVSAAKLIWLNLATRTGRNYCPMAWKSLGVVVR
jgi:hypothetical protein